MAENILDFIIEQQIPYEENVSLARKSWIKQGGTCALWIAPHSKEQLVAVCRFLYAHALAFDIVGQTSNIFFHSTYNPAIVVSTNHVNGYAIDGDTMTCDCGVSVVKLAKECLAKGYAGFYGLVGLPGTVASAAYNNASCFKCSISSMLVSADVLLPDGTVRTLQAEDFGYTHRSSVFKRGEVKGVILSVKLKLEKVEDLKEEYRKSEETVVYRRDKQEHHGRNLGSVYADRKKKYNLRNRLASFLMRNLARVRLMTDKRKAEKRILLFLYGYHDLNPYVSDRNINTFIWKDEAAEAQFARYKEFMGKVYDNLVIEIEEKM